MKTLKQEWQFERTFYNLGSLAGIKSVLYRIVEAKSTLPIESAWIRMALEYLEELKFRTNLEESWRMYEERSKG